jgi:hypothetical protein
MRLSVAVVAGATTLPITPNITIGLSINDRITIFDGSSSEVVVVATLATIGSASITIQAPGFIANHGQYSPCCSDGILGSLADVIANASEWLEEITHQPLFFTTQTETLTAPSMRAAVDNQNQLVLRPRDSVTALTALSIKSNVSTSVPYDAAQAIIDSIGLTIAVPWIVASSGGGGGGSTYSLLSRISRNTNLWITITYTHGYTLAAMPGSITDAAILLVSDILARRTNPTGADVVILGKHSLTTSTRGDTSGMTALVKDAMRKLQPWTVEAY